MTWFILACSWFIMAILWLTGPFVKNRSQLCQTIG